MKKIKTISKKEVEKLIQDQIGQDYCAEDKDYQLLPEKFFGKTRLQKIAGMVGWYYVAEGFDCDNFADKLRQQFKDRYWKKYVRSSGSNNSIGSYPDIFIECIKVQYPNARMPHWFLIAICDDGKGGPKIIFRERTSDDIVTPQEGYDIIRIK